MSSITLPQTVEKPAIAMSEDRINNLADDGQRLTPVFAAVACMALPCTIWIAWQSLPRT
jgi:hypothetical protein